MGRVVWLVALVACSSGGAPGETGGNGADGAAPPPVPLKLGYFPNLTHAPAMVALENGLVADLAPVATVDVATFNAGPSAVEALLSGALDVSFIGPNPAINAYVKSRGNAVRVISGSTSGGVSLVVQPEINGSADLKGKSVGTPQLGNTQDVALRAWLQRNGLSSELAGGGDVKVLPQENAQSLEAFRQGQLAGAWLPEPWATRLVVEGHGKVLVDERDLWPEGRFVIVHLLARTDYLAEHPAVIDRLLDEHLEALAFIEAHPDEAKGLVNRSLERLTGKPIADDVLAAAWPRMAFTDDPLPSTLRKSAEDAVSVGLLDLEGVHIDGLYDLTFLDRARARRKGAP